MLEFEEGESGFHMEGLGWDVGEFGELGVCEGDVAAGGLGEFLTRELDEEQAELLGQGVEVGVVVHWGESRGSRVEVRRRIWMGRGCAGLQRPLEPIPSPRWRSSPPRPKALYASRG